MKRERIFCEVFNGFVRFSTVCSVNTLTAMSVIYA